MDWLAGSTGRWFGGLRLVACRARYLRSSCCPGSISGRGNKGKGEPKGTQPGGQADHSITSSAHTDVLGPARPVPLSGPRGKRGGQTPRWPRLTERDVGCLLRVSRFGDDRECPDVAHSAENGRAEQVCSAQVIQTSTCSAIARASSTSIPR